MIRRAHYVRMMVIAVLAIAVFGGLGYRLVDLQVLRHQELLAKAENLRERTVKMSACRGSIYDAQGNLLAQSLPARTVAVDPTIFPHPLTPKNATTYVETRAEAVRMLAETLALDPMQVRDKMSTTNRYVVLKRKVSDEVLETIKSKPWKGLVYEDDYQRSYPSGNLCSHVVGFVDFDHRGVQGIESTFNKFLVGQQGMRSIEQDRRGREVVALRGSNIDPRDGNNVYLTIDVRIQDIIEDELERIMAENQPVSATIIAMRPSTGEILGMSSRPTFDPASPGDCPADARKNRAIQDTMEPGSTFKVLSIVAALDKGLVNLDSTIFCENGRFIFAGIPLRDHHPYGNLSLQQVIQKSSNIGTAKVALKMGPQNFYEALRRFGIGQKTGIALTAEESGVIHPLSKWSKISITRIPMGHEVTVTPLQMLRAVSAVANDGVMMKPMIVKKIISPAGQVLAEFQPVGQKVISSSASRQMTEALKSVVGREGTAEKASLREYSVAGKTGTAQKYENGIPSHSKYVSSFVGYFPAERPEISILVLLDEPRGAYYGGSTAAPAFRNVAEKIAHYLDIKPDLNFEVQMAANAGSSRKLLRNN